MDWGVVQGGALQVIQVGRMKGRARLRKPGCSATTPADSKSESQKPRQRSLVFPVTDGGVFFTVSKKRDFVKEGACLPNVKNDIRSKRVRKTEKVRKQVPIAGFPVLPKPNFGSHQQNEFSTTGPSPAPCTRKYCKNKLVRLKQIDAKRRCRSRNFPTLSSRVRQQMDFAEQDQEFKRYLTSGKKFAPCTR